MKSLKKLFGKRFKLGARGVLAALLAVTALGLAAAPASAATVVVDTTTDQSLGDCITSCSLRDAVATAAPGDTVQIPAGHYILTLGHITIAQDLTLVGDGARTTVIDGNNTSGGSRGGIFVTSGAISVEIDDVSLINGIANQAGGAISALGVFVSNPPLVFIPVALTIRRCTIANNQVTAGQAGGIEIQLGTLSIEDSTFSGNSTFPLVGGGVLASTVTGSIVNSTFSGNTAASGGGAIQLGSATMTLTNNTMTGNQRTFSSAGGVRFFFSTLTLGNNVIAGNPGGDCFLLGNTVVTDHNLDSDNSCAFTGPGDLSGVNALLGPLADNGGPTDTHALLAGSPALDAGGFSGCPATDQRGVARPQRGVCDIGAVEMVNVAPTLASDQASVTVDEGQAAANTGTVSDGNGDSVSLSASVGTVVNNGDGTWAWSFLTSDGPTQSQTVTIEGDDGQGGVSTTSFALVVVNVAPTITSVTNSGPIIAGGSATITVAATDPAVANDPLSYEFDCDDDGIFEIGPQAGNSAACTFATAGSATINVRVTDGDGGTATGSTVVTVLFPPPSCSNATASPSLLWPPNHQFVSIQIAGIVNSAPGAVTISVTSIFQDEPVQSSGSGNTSPDATGVGTANPAVRAERDGGNDGRVYHIAFTATGAGGSCTGTVTVGVPKSQGNNGGPVDQGALYDSTLP